MINADDRLKSYRKSYSWGSRVAGDAVLVCLIVRRLEHIHSWATGDTELKAVEMAIVKLDAILDLIPNEK